MLWSCTAIAWRQHRGEKKIRIFNLLIVSCSWNMGCNFTWDFKDVRVTETDKYKEKLTFWIFSAGCCNFVTKSSAQLHLSIYLEIKQIYGYKETWQLSISIPWSSRWGNNDDRECSQLNACMRAQSCLSLPAHGPAKLLCPRDFPGKNTGGGCHFLLQGIFPTQGSNSPLLSLLHCRRIILSLEPLQQTQS